MSFDSSQAFRYSEDMGGLPVPSIVGVKAYQIYLITVTNDSISFDENSSAKVTTAQRIVVGQGYASFAAQDGYYKDGYLNPIIKQEDGRNISLSAGEITSNTLLLGPIVFPYFWNNKYGGIDPSVFQPIRGNNNNTGIYIQVRGEGLSLTGNFFTVKEVAIKNMASLSYRLLLIATSTRPDLTNATFSFLPPILP